MPSAAASMEAEGDLIVVAEPDGTFLPEDLHQAARVQQGVRRRLRHPDHARADLGRSQHDWFLRWGNWGVAKLVEVMYNTSHLSDVGCTYRVLRRETAEHVARTMTVGGSARRRRK